MSDEITGIIERRDEVLAEIYARTAEDFRTMAKVWADRGCYEENYKMAQTCCIKAEAFDQLANELRRSRLLREERLGRDA